MGELQGPEAVIQEIFKDYDVNFKNELSAEQVQDIHADIRFGGISMPQVRESIKYVCVCDTCEMSELMDLLREMDRRYFLIQDLKWEFSMLDTNMCDLITEEQARWLVQTVHGDVFSGRKFERFMRTRAAPGTGVSFAEIEVLLCNIPSRADLLQEEEEERREKEEREQRERERRRHAEAAAERRKHEVEEADARARKEEERRRREQQRRLQEDADERENREREKREAEERKRKLEEEEERGRREAEERARRENNELAQAEEEKRKRDLEEARKLQEAEERRRGEEEERRLRDLEDAQNYEKLLKEAHEKEQEAKKEADHFREKKKTAKDDKLKKEAGEAEQRASLKQREWKNKRIRYALKVAISKRDREMLPPAVNDFKDSKLPDDDLDLPKAEKILREFTAHDGLLKAMANPHREGLDRHINQLEGAINFIKRNGFDYMLHNELIEANKLLLQLKKRYKIYAMIMELDQPTVAEIKSYSKPPEAVHTVMTGVFICLGHKEKEMKEWSNVRIWVGKTGMDGLKRRCLEYLKTPEKVVTKDAHRTKELLQNLDLDDVRDVSAGAATFYVWAWTMVEETDMRLAEEEYKRNNPPPATKSILKHTEEGQTGEEAKSGTATVGAEDLAAVHSSKRTGADSKETFSLSKTGKVKKTK